METVACQNINLLEPGLVDIFLDDKNNMVIQNKKTGKTYKGLKVTLMFPLTDRNSFIQFLDEQENEIGILKHIGDLDTKSRSVVVSEIEKAYFIPQIKEILSIDSQFGADVWQVMTDKGIRTFDVVGKRRNIRYLTNDRVLIKDIDGNRYEIPSVQQLNKGSQKLLQREV